MDMKVSVVKARNVRDGNQVLTPKGWKVVDSTDTWHDDGVIKLAFADGDWETFRPKERVVVMR